MGAVGYGAYRYGGLNEEKIEILSELEEARKTNVELIEYNRSQQTIIDSFQGQINDIGNTVGTLEKLARTDPELLKKYSKVYFLSENYVPSTLTGIDEKYIYNGGNNHLIHTNVWPYLERLFRDTRAASIELLAASAYRSFNTQVTLKAGYTFTYGSGANQFSADQGYSEHQLGTSVDFTTPEVGEVFSRFGNSEAYEWLRNNAHKYGFTLSYPEENAYYKFEPWHWRFVGVELATYLHEEGKYFYNLTQRQIDVYLIKLFD